MERNNRLVYNIFIYITLIIGYFLIYVIDVESFMYPNQNIETKSKVDFVYQQF